MSESRVFWCIEKAFAARDPNNPVPQWWDGEAWVTDVKSALRFADRESALLAAATVFCHADAWTITDHLWMEAP